LTRVNDFRPRSIRAGTLRKRNAIDRKSASRLEVRSTQLAPRVSIFSNRQRPARLIVSPTQSRRRTSLRKLANSISSTHPTADHRAARRRSALRSHGHAAHDRRRRRRPTFDEHPKTTRPLPNLRWSAPSASSNSEKTVVILLDSSHPLARAYNQVVASSGAPFRAARYGSLHKPKRFFGAARKIEEEVR